MDRPFAITLDAGSSLANHTGAWRTERPVYVDRLPPCNDACPAGENIQQWLYHAEEGDYEARLARRSWPTTRSPPSWAGSATGRARPRATAASSTRRSASTPSSGSSATRRIKRGWTLPGRRRRRPASGCWSSAPGRPACRAAYHLARLGHEVTVRDAGAEPGGMMRYGIPTYRLPRDVLDAEIARMLDLGVTLELGTPVDRPGRRARRAADSTPRSWPSARSSATAPTSRPATRPDPGRARVLRRRRRRRAAACSAAGSSCTAAGTPRWTRPAPRAGSAPTDAIVVYRRTRDRMPAHDIEVEEALEEGVRMRWLSTIAYAGDGDASRSRRCALDDDRLPAADRRVRGAGGRHAWCSPSARTPTWPLLDGVPGVTSPTGRSRSAPDLMTGHPGVFAGGDMVPAERTVTVGIGHGKKAARHIDAWLRGDRLRASRPAAPLAALRRAQHLVLRGRPGDRPAAAGGRPADRRTFDEVVGGLDEATALFEARRCLSCGNCFGCDNCYGVCPDNAVIKLGPAARRYEIDYDYCKGCGICAAECPCGAIAMVPEEP